MNHYATAALTGLALLVAAAQADEEVLPGGGFEGGFQDGMAEGWGDNSRGWADLDVQYARDTQGPRHGLACQRITCSRLDHGAVQFIPTAPVRLERGAVYRVRGWLRGNVGVVALQLRQAPSPYRVYVEQGIPVGDEWTELEYFWTSNVDDPNGRFMLRFVREGDLWVDGLSVRQVTPKEAARLAPQPRSGNLLHNGNFDLELAN